MPFSLPSHHNKAEEVSKACALVNSHISSPITESHVRAGKTIKFECFNGKAPSKHIPGCIDKKLEVSECFSFDKGIKEVGGFIVPGEVENDSATKSLIKFKFRFVILKVYKGTYMERHISFDTPIQHHHN